MLQERLQEPANSTGLDAFLEVKLGQFGNIMRFDLKQSRLTLGRRSYNDLELEHPTVSGEHAVIHIQNGELVIHDLNSRNGTSVNGQNVKQKALVHGDEIDIGAYKICLFVERRGNRVSQPIVPRSVRLVPQVEANTYHVIELDRVINSVLIDGRQVAIVARRRNGYFITHLEGLTSPKVNGESIGLAAFPLELGDVVEFGPVVFKFESSV